MVWTDPRTWVAGEIVTAAIMNTHVRDNLKAIGDSIVGGDTSYAVSWTAATTPPSIGNGTLTGRYFKIGRLTHVWIVLTFGTTTNAGSGDWGFSLPFTRSATTVHMGSAEAVDTGVFNRIGVPTASGSVINVDIHGVANAAACSSTVPHTWGSTDILRIYYVYLATS